MAEIVEMDAVKLVQKGLPMYVGKMKAADLLELSDIERWSEQSLDGYQRERFKEKTREIAQYLEECSIAMIPALLASFREGEFAQVRDDFGVLKIPRKMGAIWLIDGQQRTGGFNEIWLELQELQKKEKKLSKEERIDLEKYTALMNYEIAIVFVDANAMVKQVKKEAPNANIGPTHVEGAFFFIVNKTQKPVNPSLKDELAYRTLMAGIRGIPVIEKERWRTEVVPIANDLNRNGSPLKGKINLGGTRGLGRPMQLNSFVTSLEPLFKNNDNFKALNPEDKKAFLKSYWSVVKNLFEDAFNYPKDYLVLKTIGVYSLNYLANDIFNWCLSEGIKVAAEEDIQKYLEPLKGFNWSKDSSALAAFGGKKGVKEAYKILLKTLSDKGSSLASQKFAELSAKE
jgi:hypothetical protein